MVRYFVVLIFIVLYCGCENKMPVKGPYPSSGIASWHDPKHTASGEKYQRNEFTCAMRKRDFGKSYIVCNLENDKCVTVRHNDFGPAYRMFKKGRIIDLSRSAFSKIADLEKGLIRVRIGEIEPGPVD